MPAVLHLIRCQPASASSTGAASAPSTLWWDVWCKPVELTWFTWLLPLNLIEAQAVQACVGESEAALPRPVRLGGKPRIYLVAGTPDRAPRT